ncbi:MAG: DNA primase [Helicobacteraceae bacterium]|jgi:DNA primase|nr:DNA primase [Helicobacteraceae bacterium]
MIKTESIDALKLRIDIADVIGSYIELKRSGSNYMGRCPFHEEKTASFSVSPSRGLYHCFGCGASGDAIKFVQQFERIGFSDAIERLAEMHNFSLEYEQGEMPKRKDYRPLETLKRFFVDELGKGDQALEYLRKRGLNEAMIERFEIGYAPESHQQIELLNREKIPLRSAIDAGVLAMDDQGRYYARFTKRITFPIYSPQGKLVGFGGRTIAAHPAKYINSPQSAFFDKSHLLFALHIARESIIKQRSAIVCEGYMDAIMLHQAGFANAIATLGTALTEGHLPLLKKLDDPAVIVSYDSDSAGVEAALKAAKLLSAHGFTGGIGAIEGGKDPAEMIERGASETLSNAYANPKPFANFVIDALVRKSDNKDKAFAEIMGFLDTLAPFTREEASAYAAAMLGTNAARFATRQSGKRAASQAPLGSKYDLAELSLIKTLALDHSLHDRLIDYLSEELFATHADLYRAVDDENALYALLCDEKIVRLAPNEAQDVVRKLLLGFYARELSRLKHLKQIEPIKEAQEMIKRLRLGQMCPFKRF